MPNDFFAPPGFTPASADATGDFFAPPEEASKRKPIAPAFPIPGAPGLGEALGGLQDVMQQKDPLDYVLKTPARAISGGFDILRGAGLGLAGGVNAGTTAAMLAPVPGNPLYSPAEGAGRASFAVETMKAAAPHVWEGLKQNAAEEVTNPFAAFLRRPTETALDAGAIAELPSAGASIVARVAARAGMKDIAMGAMSASEALSANTRNAAVWNALKADSRTGPWVIRQENIWRTRDYVANRMKEAALAQEGKNVERAERFGPLNKHERAAVTPVLEGRASVAPGAPPEFNAAIEGQRQATAAETKHLIDTGQITPEQAERRAWQAQRVARSGKPETAPMRQNDTGEIPSLNRIDAETAKLKARPPRTMPVADAAQALAEKAKALNSPDLSLEVMPTDDALHIVSIKATKPGSGHAVRAMRQLTKLADEYGVPLTGEAMPLAGGEVSDLNLSRFYSHFGAKPISEGAPFMRRDPVGGAGGFARTFPKEFEAVVAGEMEPGEAIHKALGPGTIIEDATLASMKNQLARDAASVPKQPTYVSALEQGPKGFSKLIPPEFRAQTPGYLRHSTGETIISPTRELDIAKISALHDTHFINNQKNLGILSDVMQDPQLARPVSSPRDPSIDWETQSLIAPGAYARNMVDHIHPVDAALRSPDPAAAIDKVARSVIIPDGQSAEGLAESMGPFYVVPKYVAHELNGQMGGWYAGLPPAMRFAGRLAFDGPNQFLRVTALTLRPGFYINNLVGNTAMAGLAGATGKSVAAAASGEAVPTIARGTGFAASESPALPGAFGQFSKVGNLSRAANEGIDELARSSAFLGNVDRAALRKSILETGTRMDKAMSYAEKMEFLGPEGIDRAAKEVSQFLNDYANQAPWQRNALRNVLPFQSFLVHMTKLIARLPATHPLRAQLVAQFATLSNEYQDEGFRQAGIDPEEVQPYRKGLLPVNADNSGVSFLGSAGFNPTSGMGTSSAEMAYDPSPEGIGRAVLGGAGPGLQYGAQVAAGKNSLGHAFTKPGTYRTFGIDQAYDKDGNPTRAPVPSAWDYVRGSFQPIKIAEAIAQPNETYDLTGTPFTPNYLPEGGADNTGTKDGPRRYNAGEMLASYSGFPFRSFDREELVISEREKKVRSRIATRSKPEVVELRKQIKETEAVISAAKLANDTATVSASRARLKQLQDSIKQATKSGGR